MARRPEITLVEDDRDAREMLTSALEAAGFTVSSAANGLRLISSLHVDRPDLILLDVGLRWIDGLELCRSIQKNEEFREIPVIFVSARGGADAVREGLDAGAVDYFVKPVNPDRLAERIREVLAARQA